MNQQSNRRELLNSLVQATLENLSGSPVISRQSRAVSQAVAASVLLGAAAAAIPASAAAAGCPTTNTCSPNAGDVQTCGTNTCTIINGCSTTNECSVSNTCEINACEGSSNSCVTMNVENCTALSNQCATNNSCLSENYCTGNTCKAIDSCSDNTCAQNTCGKNTCSSDDSCVANVCTTSDTDCGWFDTSCFKTNSCTCDE